MNPVVICGEQDFDIHSTLKGKNHTIPLFGTFTSQWHFKEYKEATNMAMTETKAENPVNIDTNSTCN